MNMEKLSVCLIVKNEEPVLERCLSCVVRFADELIVVDTGSTDNSAEIAGKYTTQVYHHSWENSFAKARNYSYSKSTGDYIMWLDADDVISDENIEKIIELKKETCADVIFTKYRDDSETGLYSYVLRDRIIKRSVYTHWEYDIHESIPVQDKWKRLDRDDIEIVHKKEYVNEPERNMNIFRGLIDAGRQLEPFEKSNLIKELSLHNKPNEAVELLNKSRDEFSEYSYDYALNYVTPCLIKNKRWKECAEIIETAQTRMHSTARMVYSLGYCAEKSGDEKRAEQLYKEAMTVNEDPLSLSIRYTGYDDYYPRLRLAEIAYRKGNLTEALHLIELAGKLYPKAEEWKKMRLRFALKIDEPESTASEEIHNDKVEKLKREIEALSAKISELSSEDIEKIQREM